jgi:hypothetical protein
LKFAALSQGRQDREAGPRQDLSAQDGTQNQDDYLAAFFMKVGIGAGLLGWVLSNFPFLPTSPCFEMMQRCSG